MKTTKHSKNTKKLILPSFKEKTYIGDNFYPNTQIPIIFIKNNSKITILKYHQEQYQIQMCSKNNK